MNTIFTALTGRRRNVSLLAMALVMTAAVAAGSATSIKFITKATAIEGQAPLENSMKNGPTVSPSSLVGTYEVTGTDPEGRTYVSPRKLDVTLAPSGALELQWDNGKNVGVGQVVSGTLAVATWAKDRTVILTMNIHPDGSLSGNWLRRTDRGAKGTEAWRRI